MALQAGILVSPLAESVANCGGFITVPVSRRAIGNRQRRCRPLSSALQVKPVSQDARAGMVRSGEIFGSLPSTSTSSPVPSTSSNSSSRIHRIPKEKTRTWQQADHLLVLVHGINAGPKDWDDVIEVLRSELGSRFLIHASSANPTFQTFIGVDLAGKRLADEVWQIVKSQSGLQRISFVAHSLGGLFQRYAIANLYNPNDSTIAGLEPVQFVTIATPHLGMRGSKSLPMAFGMPILEELAAIFTIGRTATQLFLMDGEPKESPLLLCMVTDCNEGQFISALGAFHSRVTYANVSFDQMVKYVWPVQFEGAGLIAHIKDSIKRFGLDELGTALGND